METVDKNTLREVFRKSWSRKTSYPKTQDQWSAKNPSFGQCAVTSLVVNDLYGGKIVYNRDYHHYWNVLDNGTEVDLTKEQFGKNVTIQAQGETTREYLLNSDGATRALTPQRYDLLKKEVEKNLSLLVEAVK